MTRRSHSSAIWLLAFCLMHVTTLCAQDLTTNISIRINFDQAPLSQALIELSAASGINIVFSPDMVPDRVIDRAFNARLSVILASLLNDTELAFRELDGQIILYRNPEYFSPFNVSGYVEDAETGERIFAAHVYDLVSGDGAVTNEYGFFSLQSKGKNALLRVSYLGCQHDTVFVDRDSASVSQLIKFDRLIVLREVIVEDDESRHLIIEPLSRHHYNDRQLASKSFLGGELDIQRYAETLPGVSIGTDGIGGMHVRGGNGDQNLVLFDGVPIYHATHAIGILSVFNPLMIREVSLLKGDFPARYAGRLSSVLDVRTREGNNREWSFQTNIGLATANVLFEGPVVKDKIGILVAARRFLPGFYLRNLASREKADNGLTGDTEYAFTDFNAKCNIALTSRDRIFLSYYHGDDRYQDLTTATSEMQQSILTESFERHLNWGNSVGILRWNHQFGQHVFANTTFTLSRFELESRDNVNFTETLPPNTRITGFTNRKFASKITDAGVRFDLDHFLNNSHRLRYGISYTRHKIAPKSIAFDDAAEIDGFPINEELIDALLVELETTAAEVGLYIEEYAEIGSAIILSAGLHVSAFDVRDTALNARDTLYWSLQPRASARVRILDNVHGHLSANAMTQFMHLLTSSGIGLPTDLWVPSTVSVKPEYAKQLSGGISWQITKRLKIQSEAYYRTMRNLVAYREGASFLIREGSVQSGILDAANWEDKVTQGSGKAYGIETQVSYANEWCNVDVAYTRAHSTREFAELNFGNPFDFRFDRRHAISVSGTVHITNAFMVSVGWNYASGIPITLAQSKFAHPSSSPVFPPVVVLEFSEYNTFRLPDYHRLDFGARYYWRRPKATHSLHLDFYNVYNRHNVLYIALVQDGDEFRNQKFTVLPFIPSLSYQLKI